MRWNASKKRARAAKLMAPPPFRNILRCITWLGTDQKWTSECRNDS